MRRFAQTPRRHRVHRTPNQPHPTTCQCDGTGWIPGPPIPSSANGRAFEYSTVTPCPGPARNELDLTPPPPPLHQRRVGKTIIDATQFF